MVVLGKLCSQFNSRLNCNEASGPNYFRHDEYMCPIEIWRDHVQGFS